MQNNLRIPSYFTNPKRRGYSLTMKIAVVFLAIFILAIALPAVTTSLFDFRTDTIEEEFAVATGGAVTTAAVILASPLWEGSVAYATVASNETTEVPTTSAYNETIDELTIANLNASTGHLLTVTYQTAGLTDYSGAEEGVTKLPVAVVAAVIILPLALMAGYFGRRR